MSFFLSSLRLISKHSLRRDIERWWTVKVLFFSFCILLVAIVTQPYPSTGRAAPSSIMEKLALSEETALPHHSSSQTINLGEARNIFTAYDGPKKLSMALASGQARSLSLTSADFDEDGVADVASGYGYARQGVITIQCGNADSIYPNSPEAVRHKAEGTFTESPFQSIARIFEAPVSADFIGAGDFDADGHWDIVVAANGGDKLYLLSGDGLGRFAPPSVISLPGKVTAMAVGEINRPDGLEDLVVTIEAGKAWSALVFENPEGAMRAIPEVVDLPAKATSLALGQLDESYEMDLAIAAGHEVIVVDGRDRRLSLDERRRAEVGPAMIHRRAFPFALQAVAVGDFIGDQSPAIAILSEDGDLHLFSRPPHSGQQINEWPDEISVNAAVNESSYIKGVRISGTLAEDLLIIDSKNRHFQVLLREPISAMQSSTIRQATLDLDAEPVAILPLRLNEDALTDLVMLDAAQNRLAVAKTKPQAVITVTNTNDRGPGSLRQAILDANSRSNTDTIRFQIPGSGIKIINLETALPMISGPVTIDGTTQPGFAGSPIIFLRGGDDSIIKIIGGNTTVRGIDICSRCNGAGLYDIEIINAGGNQIEGNTIRGAGISISTANNVVGGTTTSTRNTFIAPGVTRGVLLSGPAATNNRIMGNYFLVPLIINAVPLPSCGSIGISIDQANGNIIGGTKTGSGNVFSGSSAAQNIQISGATGSIIQGNFIGTDINGTRSASSFGGISLTLSPSTMIGGTTPNARNIISGHLGPGIAITSNPTVRNEILIQGNYVGTDVTGTRALGNGPGIIVFNSPGTTIGGATAAARNIISGNREDGVGIGLLGSPPCIPFQAEPGGSDYTLQQNYIGTDVSGVQPLGNLGDGVIVYPNSFSHEINSNRIAFNKDGIHVTEVKAGINSIPGFSIKMISNAIHSNSRLGIELGDNGVIANDPRDLDTGANERQNFPVLRATTSAKVAAGDDFTTKAINSITVTFNSTPLQTFTLEFFFGSNCAGSGGQLIGTFPIPLGARQVTTDANGNATTTFTFDFPNTSAGGWVNATATNSTGNTSGFSECRQVVNASLPTITGAVKQGKKLFVSGSNFEAGAKILLNGETQKTIFDSAVLIIGKKAGKVVKSGDKIKVRNPEGVESSEITFP